MALEGSLATLSFADLVQLLGSTRKTGTLQINRGPAWKKIYFRDGRIVALSSNDPEEFIGNRLLALGEIGEEDLNRALGRQHREGKLLGQVLVEEGKIDADRLRRLLADKAYEMVAQLMSWKNALFTFDEYALPTRELVPLDLRVEELVMEGFRRVDEVARLRQVVLSDDTFLERAGQEPAEVMLADSLVSALWRGLAQPRTAGELRRLTRAPEFTFLHGLSALIEAGAVRRFQGREGPRATLPPDWLEQAQRRMEDREYEEAVRHLRLGLDHDPSNTEAQALLAKAKARFARDITNRELPPQTVLALGVPVESLAERSVSPAELFLMSQIDGKTDVGALLDQTPLPDSEILLALRRLLRDGYIRIL